ncbi:MAG: SAM hydrolase/SAM-dependent halogenase family protein [Desulfobulbus sp.]|jgi:S-adenosylmethionine hydrolase
MQPAPPAPPLVTLTTDFGSNDAYVGQLKGALLRACPRAMPVDICHTVPRGDIVAAAITIATSYAFFPDNTIHLVVVDPEVGGDRAILAAEADSHRFIAPDNGVLSLLVRDRRLTAVHQVDLVPFGAASPTFHGRDIMAPVAGRLAGGLALSAVGPAMAADRLRTVPIPAAQRTAHGLQGQVLHIDHFGNLRTSIRPAADRLDWEHVVCLEIRGRRIDRQARHYSEAPTGELLALVDSAGYLEIAANQDSAARLLGSLPGDPVLVRTAPA